MSGADGGAPVLIRHYTDPSCPYAFSAERQRLRLEWLYGEQLDWELHMVVLSDERPGDVFPPERIASTRRDLQLRFGMPIDWRPVEAGASLPACRAVVATRLHAPDREAPLLRRLRVLNFSALDLDDPEVIDRAASEALIEPGELLAWGADPEVDRVLQADMLASRSPSPASRAGLQARRSGGAASLHVPLLRADPRHRAARRLADREPRRPPGLPARRGLRGRPREHRPRAGAPARPGVRRGGPRVGRDADRHRRGRRRLRSRGRRRPDRARSGRHVPAGRRRRLLDRRRLTGAVPGPC